MNKASKLALAVIIFGACGYGLIGKHESQDKPSESIAESAYKPLRQVDGKKANSSVDRSPASKSKNVGPKGEAQIEFVPGIYSRLEEIKGCLSHTKCEYPQTDPRSYELAVGQALKAELQKLSRHALREGLENERLSEVAREFLAFTDGHVKKAALDLLATQPPSDENLKSVLEDALDSYDSNLTGQSLAELRKYDHPEDRKRIEASIRKILAQGSFRVKQKIAELIGPVLNSENLGEFETFAQSLPPDSLVSIHLTAALNEFRKRLAGG